MIYPLKKWIKWWHDCQSHIFLLYHGTRIPMVNLSEQGHKLIKPSHTMRLVHAAKYDTSVMMFQANQLKLYGMNMVTVESRGANQAAREEHDRHDQIIIAKDFNNIVDNEEAIETEAMEGVVPANYVPKSNTKHKPPRTSPDEVASGETSSQNEVQGQGCG